MIRVLKSLISPRTARRGRGPAAQGGRRVAWFVLVVASAGGDLCTGQTGQWVPVLSGADYEKVVETVMPKHDCSQKDSRVCFSIRRLDYGEPEKLVELELLESGGGILRFQEAGAHIQQAVNEFFQSGGVISAVDWRERIQVRRYQRELSFPQAREWVVEFLRAIRIPVEKAALRTRALQNTPERTIVLDDVLFRCAFLDERQTWSLDIGGSEFYAPGGDRKPRSVVEELFQRLASLAKKGGPEPQRP